MGPDEYLHKLKRAAEQSPEDEAVGALYEAALLRAGARGLMAERLRFDLVCDKRWEDLPRGRFQFSSKQRFCQDCQMAVYWVSSQEELRQHAACGSCVAVPVREVDARIEGMVEDALREGQVDRPRCLVPGKRRESPPINGWWSRGVRLGSIAFSEGF